MVFGESFKYFLSNFANFMVKLNSDFAIGFCCRCGKCPQRNPRCSKLSFTQCDGKILILSKEKKFTDVFSVQHTQSIELIFIFFNINKWINVM